MKYFQKIIFITILTILLFGCTKPQEESKETQTYPKPSGNLILGTMADSCGQILSEPYQLDAYFENHPYNQENYTYYVYRDDDYLNSNYWFGYQANVVLSYKISEEMDQGDLFRVDWVLETIDDETQEESDKVIKKHTITGLLPCENGDLYLGSNLNLSETEITDLISNLRVDIYYNDRLVDSKMFNIDGVS
ncbi:hypothetical protein KKC94_00660 [Patescibacteria group bacterium]|nr:hypothetical protein [Patescibacteria group bacterium]